MTLTGRRPVDGSPWTSQRFSLFVWFVWFVWFVGELFCAAAARTNSAR